MFGVTTGQDYNIHFINASDVLTVSALASIKRNLTNEEWQSLYDTQYVPKACKLYLIIDKFGLGVNLDPNSSSLSWYYLLTTQVLGSTGTYIPGPIWPINSTISVDITLNAKDMTYSIQQPPSILTFNVTDNGSNMPEVTWPDHVSINASTDDTWKAGVSIDDQGWLYPASLSNQTTTLHIAYGLSTHVQQSNSIQVARMFIVVVIICNILKTFAIYMTLRNSFSPHILTLGDAVSSCLKSPDPSTLGACILSKKELVRNISHDEKHKSSQWRHRRVHYLLGVIGNGWITYSILWVLRHCLNALQNLGDLITGAGFSLAQHASCPLHSSLQEIRLLTPNPIGQSGALPPRTNSPSHPDHSIRKRPCSTPGWQTSHKSFFPSHILPSTACAPQCASLENGTAMIQGARG